MFDLEGNWCKIYMEGNEEKLECFTHMRMSFQIYDFAPNNFQISHNFSIFTLAQSFIRSADKLNLLKICVHYSI
jgi:hypothetical protein